MQTIDLSPTPERLRAARRNIAARAWRRRASRLDVSSGKPRRQSVSNYLSVCAHQLAAQIPGSLALYLAALEVRP